MKAKSRAEPDDKEQSARFVETARKLEADESGKAFERVIGSITKSSRALAKKKKE